MVCYNREMCQEIIQHMRGSTHTQKGRDRYGHEGKCK